GSDDQATRQALETAQAALARFARRCEILLLADAANASGLKLLAATLPLAVKIIERESASARNWQAALLQATHEWIVVAAGDGRYDLGELSRLLPFTEDFDVVHGYRSRASRPGPIAALDRGAALLANLFLRTGVRDPGCGLKVFRRSFLAAFPGIADDDFFPYEVLARLRLAEAKIVEVPVTYAAEGPPAWHWQSNHVAGRVREGVAKSVIRPVCWLARLARFWWSECLFPPQDAAAAARLQQPAWQGRAAAIAWGILIATAFVYFYGHLSYPLLEPDESRYARIAEQMVRSGDYIVPRRFGEPYLDKPPLLYWLTAASYHLFGVSDGAARIACATSAFAAVLATYAIGRRLVGQRAAWIGAFSLMLCSGFALGGKFLLMDGLLTCLVTLTMMCGYLAIQGPRVRPGWCVAASVFCGLGVMTKGPLAIVLFLPPLFAARWLSASGARLSWRDWLLCFAPGAMIALPWFVAVSLREPQFLEYFFWRHNIERFTTDFSHDQPWWYYIPVLLLGMFPASLLLGPLVNFLLGSQARVRALRTPQLGYLTLVAAWILVFFSLSRGKLPPYIIPALPPLCLLCGKLLEVLIWRDEHGSIYQRTRAFMPELIIQVGMVGVAVVGIVDLAMGGGRNFGFVLDGALIAAGTFFFFYLPRGALRPMLRSWLAAGAVAWFAMAYAFLDFYPDIARSRSLAVKAQTICEEYGNAQMPIIFFGRREESLIFYLPDERIHQFQGHNPGELVEFLRHHPHTVMVSDRDDIAALRESIPTTISIAEMGGRGHLFLTSTAADELARTSGPASK
ncbi:MAG: glycosyltransferase family 39 protein, partial [Planctomycetaceae bacterium]|nr:glycosyltransferase family 39 protein [Planctomycetaceae bacterium]